MDRGRIIDNIQNTNARYIDNFGQGGKTSVNVSNPPGGKSSFSFGWNEPEVKPTQKVQAKNSYNYEEPTYSNKNKKVSNNYDYDDQVYSGKNQKSGNTFKNNVEYEDYSEETTSSSKTNVKVKQAPGGKSNFSLGYDNVNYNDYRKNI